MTFPENAEFGEVPRQRFPDLLSNDQNFEVQPRMNQTAEINFVSPEGIRYAIRVAYMEEKTVELTSSASAEGYGREWAGYLPNSAVEYI